MPWPIEDKHVKRYPHFDDVATAGDLIKLATDPDAVRRHAFFPFLRYQQSWKPFKSAVAGPRQRKVRPIRYAARRDAAIYAYYRHQLAALYEAELARRGIGASPIAYRKLVSPATGRGKCNADFAGDAFSAIRSMGDCCAITLDISQFFESLDHGALEAAWVRLLSVPALPKDHLAVFLAITKYSDVDRNAAYQRLGFFGMKRVAGGRVRPGYVVSKRNMPSRLCTIRQFRDLICGGDTRYPSLLEKNKTGRGIPQGSPISDVLANLYMLEFDTAVQAIVVGQRGVYFRYSDDIFIAVPGDATAADSVICSVQAALATHCPGLSIKAAKTSRAVFTQTASGNQQSVNIDRPNATGGLDYLGFPYDGQSVYIRESTISKLHRKIAFAARSYARMLARRFPGQDRAYLERQFNLARFEQRYGRVSDFESRLSRKRWTFHTYVKRCSSVFPRFASTFHRQLRNHRAYLARARDEALSRIAQP